MRDKKKMYLETRSAGMLCNISYMAVILYNFITNEGKI